MISALALLLAAAAPEVPPDCAPADHACKAERFSRLAAQTDDPALRAQRLYVAHRSYLSLHKETGDPRALCRARELLDRGRAIDPLPPPLVEPLRMAASSHPVPAGAETPGSTCSNQAPPASENTLPANMVTYCSRAGE